MKVFVLCLVALFGLATNTKHRSEPVPDSTQLPGKTANKPLFRDPLYDGAADPVVVWNRRERKWFMLYTNRRANL